MTLRTLADLLPEIRSLGDREALRYHNGLRTWTRSYDDLYGAIGSVVGVLDDRHIAKGDRVLVWGENHPAWVAVFWACVARGVEVVPVDYRSSRALVDRIQGEVGARLLVHGSEVDVEMPRVSFAEIDALAPRHAFEITGLTPDDVAEIVYTSGTTGDPKGVVHRHRNVCANLNPIRHEIDRYRRLARPVQPIRLLDLLPLSHLFGQATGVFIPVVLGGAVVFTTDFAPRAVIETIRRERVSVLVAVPRIATTLRGEIERRFDLDDRKNRLSGWLGVAEKWWRHRDVHRTLGPKFWCLVVGGAPIEPGLEAFWRGLGFVVVQGYGLTESSPVVALNHPFHARPGSIGKAIAGQDIRLAPDGEILVRGPSVVEGDRVDEEGWLHTGDIGEIDVEENLYYRGRKKEMIVTADGLNVYPSDVEAVLDRLPGVRESAVVGFEAGGESRVHAVVIADDPDTDVAAVVREANARLEPHQRIRGWSAWPERAFPRTTSTHKIKRGEIAAWVAAERVADVGSGGEGEASGTGAEVDATRELVAELARRDAASIGDAMRLDDDLGLSSLDRVELLSRLEADLGVELDEEAFARVETVTEIEQWARAAREAGPAAGKDAVAPDGATRRTRPRWTRVAPFRGARRALLDAAIVPLFRNRLTLRVDGLDHLADIEPPVLFAANHASHLDTVAVYAALPRSWRPRIAPAMMQDYFRDYFDPQAGAARSDRTKAAALYHLACGAFNAYPLPQRMSGTRRALRYTGELVGAGYCPLVYPEGERTPTGEMNRFKPGIGLMAVRLQLPVVPIAIHGMFDIYSIHHDWPERGEVVVRFGTPLVFEPGTSYEDAAQRVEEAVHRLIAIDGGGR